MVSRFGKATQNNSHHFRVTRFSESDHVLIETSTGKNDVLYIASIKQLQELGDLITDVREELIFGKEEE